MFFKKRFAKQHQGLLSPEVTQMIEDAILLGDVHEIDDALTVISMDDDVPKDLRYGLEALRHFRAHYGQGRDLEPQIPLQKQKAAVMEIAWGAELIDMLRNEGKIIGIGRA